MENLEKLLDPKEIGEILKLKKSKINRMLANGDIPSMIVSQGVRRRVFRVKPSELARWMQNREVRQ